MADNFIKQLEKEIPALNDNIRIEKLTKGFSDEQKFIIYYPNSSRGLLRIAKIDGYERKKTEFGLLKKLQNYNVKCPKPIAVGLSKKLDSCYIMLSYIEGQSAEEVLVACTEKEQYLIGFEAGQDLRRMHLLCAPTEIEPWHSRKLKKHSRFLDEYKKCGVTAKNENRITSFIDNNSSLIENRPSYFQHDDFHVGNIIARNKHYAGVIDFNRYDWGDPIHEFYKLAWFSRKVSAPFAIGQVNGYFDNNIPYFFWKLYSLYLAMSIFPSIVWCLRTTPNRVPYFTGIIDTILDDHENFRLIQPKWYKNYE